MGTQIGKRFEGQLIESFRRDYPEAWTHKHPTVHNVGPRGYSVKTPPDLQVVAPEFSLLIEAKARKGVSIPWDALAEHQVEHLRAFDDVRADCHGLVAILSYNGKLGHARRYDAWLLPINEWLALQKGSRRKSLALYDEKIAKYISPYKVPWLPGRFEMRPTCSRVFAV